MQVRYCLNPLFSFTHIPVAYFMLCKNPLLDTLHSVRINVVNWLSPSLEFIQVLLYLVAFIVILWSLSRSSCEVK